MRTVPPSSPEKTLLSSVVDLLDTAEQAHYDEAFRKAVRGVPKSPTPHRNHSLRLLEIQSVTPWVVVGLF